MTQPSGDNPKNAAENGNALDDPRVWEVISAYQHEVEKGNKPNRADYLAKYPELADAIGDCLDGLQMLEQQLADTHSRPRAARESGSMNEFAQPTAPLGDFQIVGEIARGGMGIVYEAIQLSLGRRVALKVLPFAATVDSRNLQRFKIEAQAAALLHHTHIVPVYGIGCERGVHYYAMQLIEGQSLAAIISQVRQKENTAGGGTAPSATEVEPPSSASARPQALHSTVDVTETLTTGKPHTTDAYLRRACRLIIQAAEGLEHAHQSGVVHRDIKPANLLVDVAGNLWITDFGLAQLQTDVSLTRSGDMLGTFRYMSPEQSSGQRTILDHRTDIYSLGVTLYELLTLRPAFSADNHQELLYHILHNDPDSPRKHNPAISSELELIVLKAISKSPADRYATAAAMAADLQRYLDHKPILAKPPTLIDRVRKWSRRHPSLVVAGVLLLLVIAASATGTAWIVSFEQQKTANALGREKQRAQEAEQRYQQARKAVDTLFQISEEELTDRPMEEARKRILEVVLTHYEQFMEQREGDVASQAELAQAQNKVKSLLRELDILQNAMDYRLLVRPDVQDELRLTADQKSFIQAAWEGDFDNVGAAMRAANEADRRAGLVAIAERQKSLIDSLLTMEQSRRFRQVAIQSRGLFAFKDRTIIQKLALTPQQREEIREIEHAMFLERFQGSDHPPGPGPGPRPDGKGPPPHPPHNMQEHMNKVLLLLTEKQKQTWQELIGSPFRDVSMEWFPPPPPKRKGP